MSKKTKRQLRRETVGVSSAPLSTPISGNGVKTSEFNPDYSYILKDLRRIAMLAGSITLVLIVLSFIF